MVSNVKLISIGVVAMGLSACAGVGTATRGGGAEVRGMAAVRAESPLLIAEGPVHLLHVDVHGQRGVSLYAAVRHSGTDSDCLAAGPAGRSLLRRDRRNPLVVDVPDGQVVCLAPAELGPGFPAEGIEVSWHARRETGMPSGTIALDSGDR
jgi:hypothetical protein